MSRILIFILAVLAFTIGVNAGEPGEPKVVLERYIPFESQKNMSESSLKFFEDTVNFIDLQKDAQQWTRVRKKHIEPVISNDYKRKVKTLSKDNYFQKILNDTPEEGIGYYIIYINSVEEITKERISKIVPYSEFEIHNFVKRESAEKPDEGHLNIKVNNQLIRVDYKIGSGEDFGVNFSKKGYWNSKETLKGEDIITTVD